MVNLSDTTKGDISELECQKQFMEQGWKVTVPASVNECFDLVIKKNNKWETVQVKTARVRTTNGCITPSVEFKKTYRGKKIPYELGDFDLLAAVLGFTIWLFPFETIAGKTRLCLSTEYDKYNLKNIDETEQLTLF